MCGLCRHCVVVSRGYYMIPWLESVHLFHYGISGISIIYDVKYDINNCIDRRTRTLVCDVTQVIIPTGFVK